MNVRGRLQSEKIMEWDLETNDAGELTVGGCSTTELTRMYGTPLHVVNEERLIRTAESFRETLTRIYPGKVSVHFAFKCNPVPGIIQIIKNRGIRAEVMSEYELFLALKLGYCGTEIVVNGPSKTESLIKASLENQVRLINVDSLCELEQIGRMCKMLNKSTDVLFRINPDFVPSGMNQGSAAAGRSGSPFGLDLKGGEVQQALSLVKDMKRVTFRGFHFHIGSGIQQSDDYRKALLCLKNIVNYTQKSGFSIDILDIGGGLGIPTSREMTTFELLKYEAFDFLPSIESSNRSISFDKFAESVTRGIKYLFENNEVPELIIEPGRCLTSQNQMLLIQVLQVKERRGVKKWIVADAGIGTLTMPTYYEIHEVILCNEVDRKLSGRVTITGPGCFTADVVYRNKQMPEIAPGEFIAILDSGAYFTSWESSFGYPRPAIVKVSNGKHEILRSRESFDHMIALDNFQR